MIRSVLKYLLVCSLVLGPVLSLTAQETMQSLNAKIAKYEEDINRNEKLLGKIRNDKKTSLSELKLIRSRITSRQKIIVSLHQQMVMLEREIDMKQKNVAGLEKDITKLKTEYGDMVYAAYKNYKLNNSMAFIFASKDFNDATRRIDYMRRYNSMRKDKAHELDSMSRVLNTDLRELAHKQEELSNTKKSRDMELTTLRTDENSYKKSSEKLAKEEQKIAKTIKEKEKEKQKAQSQLKKLIEQEARKSAGKKLSAAEERELAILSDKFENNKGKFLFPVDGGVIVDPYGVHIHPTQPDVTVENIGVNIAGEKGAAVHSVFDGVVYRMMFVLGLNNCVMIRHGNYFTVYANLADVKVKVNDKVRTNQVIGNIPSTGDNDDYFLHFELLDGLERQNPEEWFK